MTAKVGLRILIADDNRDLAENLSEIMQAAGHNPVVVFDGESAVDRALQDDFDMAVLDVTMPRKNGFRACAEMHSGHPKLPVILITGYEHRPERALDSGAKAMLNKPVDIDQLLSLIQRFSQAATF